MEYDTFELPYTCMSFSSIIIIMLASKQKGKANAFVNGYSYTIYFDLILNKTHEVRIILIFKMSLT